VVLGIKGIVWRKNEKFAWCVLGQGTLRDASTFEWLDR